MSTRKTRDEKAQDQERAAARDAEEGQVREAGLVPPSDHVVDPANTGPGTSHPEADPVAGLDPDRAVSNRKARDETAEDRK